jgi:WD40 repeat protein
VTCHAGQAPATTEKPASVVVAEFQPLFNGKDLSDWKFHRCTSDAWKIQDGVLRTEGTNGGQSGWLVTEREYADFELRLECRLSKGADSGVAFRALVEGTLAGSDLEVQIRDDDAYPDSRLVESTGSLYDVAARSQAAIKSAGEWNRFQITARQRRVLVVLNDKTVLDVDLADSVAKAARHPGITRKQGVIGLQTFRGRVEYRNLAIKILDAGNDSDTTSTPVTRGADAAQPHLVLNSDGHTARVARMLFTPDDKRIVSVSNDKSIRIWDVASGETTSILRPPIGLGLEGELLAGAISHDGKYLAAGGDTAGLPTGSKAVYLIDLDSGRIERLFDGHLSSILTLDFSPDDKHLVSGAGDRTARIWNVANGASEHVLGGLPGSVTGAAFSPDGQFVALGCIDSSASIWSVTTGKKLHDLKGHTAGLRAVAWSPDGKTIATSGFGRQLFLWNPDGSLRKKDSPPHDLWSLAFTADSRRLLAGAAGAGSLRLAPHPCLWVDVETLERQPAFSHHTANVLGVALSRDGSLAVSSSIFGDDAYLWQTKDGSIVHRLGGAGREANATAWSRDAKMIAWGNVAGNAQGNAAGDGALKPKGPLHRAFSLSDLDFVRIDGRFVQHNPGPLPLALAVSNDLLAFEIKRGNKLVGTWQMPQSRSHFITGTCLLNETRAIVGSVHGWIYLVDLVKRELIGTYEGHLGPVYAISPSPDGRRFLTASNDQTLRIWSSDITRNSAREIVGLGLAVELRGRDVVVTGITSGGPAARDGRLKIGDIIKGIGEQDAELTDLTKDPYAVFVLLKGKPGTIVRLNVLSKGAKEPSLVELERKHVAAPYPMGEPLLSFFVEGNEWIAWTEEGYYACSPGGENLMGWQVNNGPARMATFSPAGRFHKTFYRPDVIKRLLEAGSVEKALAMIGTGSSPASQPADLLQTLPPKVALTYPATSGQKIDSTKFEVKSTAVGAGNRPVVSLRLLVDGRPYQGDAGLKTIRDPKPGEVREGWKVELPPGRHRLAVIAASSVSQTVSDEIEVVIASPAAPGHPPTSSLHVVAVGINNYPGRMKLDCAAPDAQAIEQAFRTQSSGLYQVSSSLLVNQQATRQGIFQALDALTKRAKSGDVAVVFYAGHGDCKIAGQFYLLPVDVNLGKLTESGVSGEELRSRLAKLPCTVLLVMDCCYAGSFDAGKKKRALPNEAGDLVRELISDDQGLVVMCGASNEQESGEETKLGHGYFTQALIEGLEGKAASRRDGLVYLTGLQNYVEERVRELSHDEQCPTIGKPTLIRSFPLSKPKPKQTSAKP